ncbi:MAG: hypothetical protein KC442_24075 [Thermomicrobiales bacterium]|nr:hypothetical protein [Thermomicrobiales bacterium]
MHSSDLALSHYYALRRHEDLLTEAERNYKLNDAYADQIPAPRSIIVTLRAGIAHVLLSIGARLMPAESTPSVHRVAGNWELRLG